MIDNKCVSTTSQHHMILILRYIVMYKISVCTYTRTQKVSQ